jgi:putative pyruvate formate lyase activating enzyme
MQAFTKAEEALLSSCTLCPRKCGVNRFSSALGFCNSDAGFGISSICCHRGEEPVISGEKGICNIFFSHCNMQCNFCQNHHISRNTGFILEEKPAFNEIIYRICDTLEQTENIIGFVSPSHRVPQMMAIISGIHQAGKRPITVYNTNGYDRVETLQMLEGLIDVYLPDFKYSDSRLAKEYSQTADYPKTALAALKEIYRQKGSALLLNNRNIAESGIIVRHLVLPGAAEQSIEVLRTIAEDISPGLHISLMSQYYPTDLIADHPVLNRTITRHEFESVVEAFHRFGFYHGWVQGMESHSVFHPDFFREQPFGD